MDRRIKFQSTPSAREGDIIVLFPLANPEGFNPRLPRGKATRQLRLVQVNNRVSIHAFREGRRLPDFTKDSRLEGFQSTPSAREGDFPSEIVADVARVSIHAFREGRRRGILRESRDAYGFNPRLPRGKATNEKCLVILNNQFQSTPSAREGDFPANRQVSQ